MWTKEHRERQKQFERQRYPTDLSDAEWEYIQPLLPAAAQRGRKISVDLREVLNALRYLAWTGCGWRLLPVHFPPWQTVYWWFRNLLRHFLFRTIHDILVMIDRDMQGREASPGAGVLDSQTVKAPNATGGGGYDAGKKIKERKRHVAVDTDGRLLMLNLTTADIQDAQGAALIVKAIRKRYRRREWRGTRTTRLGVERADVRLSRIVIPAIGPWFLAGKRDDEPARPQAIQLACQDFPQSNWRHQPWRDKGFNRGNRNKSFARPGVPLPYVFARLGLLAQ